MLFGVHMSTRGGLMSALNRALEMGCTTMQIFTSNPMGWKESDIAAAEAEAFSAGLRQKAFGPVFTHTAYLLNFAAAREDLRIKSVQALSGEIKRASAIGAAGIVTHLGSSPLPIKERAALIAASIDSAFDLTEPGGPVSLLLENSAGAGHTAGADFSELAAIIETSRHAQRLRVCLDTCHMWGAGYPLKPYDKARETFDDFHSRVGMDRLSLIHANDSKTELGSRKDRHEHIGEGFIGEEGFDSLFRLKSLPDDLPFIMETPGEDPQQDFDNLKKLCRIYRQSCDEGVTAEKIR